MPLDPNKIAHIQSVRQRTLANRQKTVIFVYQAAGTYSYIPTQAIFRPQSTIDPQIPSRAGDPPRAHSDLIMITAITVSYTGLVFVADTTTATASAVAAAHKYQLIEAIPTGIVPEGTHIVAYLRRFR